MSPQAKMCSLNIWVRIKQSACMEIHLVRLQLYQCAVVKTILVITSNHPKVAVKLAIGILKDLSVCGNIQLWSVKMNPMAMGRVAQTTTVETKQLVAWINFFFYYCIIFWFYWKTNCKKNVIHELFQSRPFFKEISELTDHSRSRTKKAKRNEKASYSGKIWLDVQK